MGKRLAFFDDSSGVIKNQILRMNTAAEPGKYKPCACCDWSRTWTLEASVWHPEKSGQINEFTDLKFGACYRHLPAVMQYINRTIDQRVVVKEN